MTHPALIERITRSLAYMLRHQPEQFDLELDEYGWADLREVVRALNERLGEPVAQEDVQDAVSSGDRQRYEIDRGMIRALYGHSIDVQPGEPGQPPELLFVGVSRQDAERAERFGLRPGRRRFLHLALTAEDALETAARSSEDAVLVKVHAMDAWEEGINFYDRKALYLSDPIPTHYLEIEISEQEPPPRERSRQESYAGAHAGDAPAWEGAPNAASEEAPIEGDPIQGGEAPREFAPRAPGEGGGRRRRGRRGGRGRGRDFQDDRPRPPADAAPERVQERAPERAPGAYERFDRGAPPPREDRPRQQSSGRDDRPRHGGGGGGGPRHGGAPRPAHSGGGFGGHSQGGRGGGQGGGFRGEGGAPRGDRPERGGFREDRGRPSHDDRPPSHERPPAQDRSPAQERPRREERGPAPEREGWQRREERPRPAPQADFGSSAPEERRPAPPPPPPPAPRVEAPKPAPKPRREPSGEGSFGAGL